MTASGARAHLSVQLYSVRDALADDQPAVLARLAATGLRWVEPFGLGPADAGDPAGVAASLRRARDLRRDLDAAGLRASSAHATLADDLGPLAEELSVLGAQAVFLPVPAAAVGHPMGAFEDAGALGALADRLTAAAEELGRHGVAAGYHNHWWEWAELDGRPAYDAFLDRCGDAVVLELDAYWALRAGQDPAAVARSLGDRLLALHVKSGPAGGPLSVETASALEQVPLSEGALDVEALLDAAGAARWHVLEVDHAAGDPVELVAANARTLLDLGRSST